MAKTTLIIDNVNAGFFDGSASKHRLVQYLTNELFGLAGGAYKGSLSIIPSASGVQATGTITASSTVKTNSCVVGGVTFTAVAETATPTSIQFKIAGDAKATVDATLSGVVATDTLVIGGTTLTAHATTQNSTTFAVGATDTETAANIVTAIRANTTISGKVTATSADAVVTITAKLAGPEGNAITTTSAGGHITVDATLSGGTASDAGTAANLAAAINAHTTLNKIVTATSAEGVVTITSIIPGLIGNQIVLTTGTNLTAVAMASGAGSFTTYSY